MQRKTSQDIPPQGNIKKIMRLEKQALHSRTAGERIADHVTAIAGSTPSIILHALWFGGWILINGGAVPGLEPFDRFPFTFLTMMVSLEAIFLTLLVLMSQNRAMKESDKRAHLDLQVDMLAEQESTVTLRLVRSICRHLRVKEIQDESVKQLSKATDVKELARKLDRVSPK